MHNSVSNWLSFVKTISRIITEHLERISDNRSSLEDIRALLAIRLLSIEFKMLRDLIIPANPIAQLVVSSDLLILWQSTPIF